MTLARIVSKASVAQSGEMKLIRIVAVIAALLSPALDVRAEPPPREPHVGDAYEITALRESSRLSSEGSSGSSFDKDTIVERVIGVRADGLELEYDLPKDVTADQRSSDWKFPARVFKPYDGAPQLLNRPELETRIDAWLKKAKWPRTACGHWIFTWNAFQVDCDPQSAIKVIEAFDLRLANLREGASYQVAGAREPGTLTTKAAGPEGVTFAVALEVDPDATRRARAESDVVTGEITRKPVSLETALAERAKEDVSGTISITFDTDAAGEVWRRTTVTKLEIKTPKGRSDTQAVTETVERRLLSGNAARR